MCCLLVARLFVASAPHLFCRVPGGSARKCIGNQFAILQAPGFAHSYLTHSLISFPPHLPRRRRAQVHRRPVCHHRGGGGAGHGAAPLPLPPAGPAVGGLAVKAAPAGAVLLNQATRGLLSY